MSEPTWQIGVNFATPMVDVTADVRGVSISTGRARVLDAFQAGSCRIQLDNTSGKYTPLGDGTYSAAQFVGIEVRVLVTLNSATNPTCLFRGFVEDADATFPDAKQSVVTLVCSDGLAKLGRTELTDVTFSSEVGSARFTTVLDDADVNYPAQPGTPTSADPNERAIDTSTITMAAASVAGLSTSTYLARLAQSEDGAIFIRHGMAAGGSVGVGDKGGVLTYKKRNADSYTTGLTFGPSSTVATSPPMIALDTIFGAELLYTKGVYQRAGGADQIVTDTLQTPTYGIRTLVRRNLLNNNDPDVLDACRNFVYRYSTPALRVSAITVKPNALTEAQAEKVAKLGVWDGILATFTPAGAGSAITRALRVEGVRHDITPGNWTMRINTSGTGENVYLILDSTTAGYLNENKLAP